MTKKVFLILLALVLALTVGMFGCGGEQEEEEEEEEEEEFELIILGAPLPIGYGDGQSARDNLQLAVDEINDAGGFDVGGTTYKFELEVMDTQDLDPSVPATDVQAVVENLITNKEADFIIGGPLRSETALAAMDTIAQYETVAIWSAGFLSPCFTCKFTGCDIPPCPAASYPGDADKYKYCFRTQDGANPITDESLTLMEAIASDKGLDKTAYLVCQDVAHATGAAGGFKTALEDAGWTVLGYDKIPTGVETGMGTVLDSVAASGAKFLWLDFDMPESETLVEMWYNRQMDCLPIGFVVPAHDSLAWDVFDGKCEYLVNCYVKAGITPINTEAEHYINLYKAEFGKEPGLTWVAPTSYQVVHILKDALVRAGSLDDADVIAALEDTNMTGVYGKIAFSESHEMICSTNPAEGAITTWVQWQDVSGTGTRVTVYPSTVGDVSDIVLPSWME